MNKTISFAGLDFLTVRPYLALKNLFIIILVFVFIGFGTGNGAMIVGMLMMYSAFYISFPFAVSEKNGLDNLYATLPVTRKQVVSGRYLFALLLNLVMGLAAFFTAIAIMSVFRKSFSVHEITVTVLLCFVLYTVVQSIQLPIFFKLGYSKAKLLTYLPLIGFPAVVVIAAQIFGKENWLPVIENTLGWIEGNITLSIIAVVLIWMIIMTVSWHMSCRFYRKREF